MNIDSIFGFFQRTSPNRSGNIADFGATKNNLDHLLRESIRSRELGYLYVPLGKNANTQIKRWLWAAEVENGFATPVPTDYFGVHENEGFLVNLRASPWVHYYGFEVDRFKVDFNRSFSFSVVRNPYSRLLSAYLDKIYISADAPYATRDRIQEDFLLPYYPETFSSFVHLVARQSNDKLNPHWRSQSFTMCYNVFKYSFIGYFECLDKIFYLLTDKYLNSNREPMNLANHATHATRASDKLDYYYDNHLANLVFERFEEDFRIFGYSNDYSILGPIRARAEPTSISMIDRIDNSILASS